VALFHVRAYSYVGELPVLQHAYLFVDFFFVLSGFVLGAAYAERLSHGFSIWEFMVLRFGRVYPLHLFMLLLFVATHVGQGRAFDSSEYSAQALIGNVLLVQSLGFFATPTWNMPSWSISTEFFAYLAFALGASLLRQRMNQVLVAVALGCAAGLMFLKGHINASHDFGVLRCLCGFSVGVLAWEVFRRWNADVPKGTRAEAFAAGASLCFVAVAGESAASLLAPVVFAAVVLVFAREAGALSALLRSRIFLWLGTLSYSIYMVHFFLAHRMVELLTLARERGFPGAQHLGVDRWAGDAVILAYMVLVIAVSALTYRFVEVPARDWFRRVAPRRPTAVGARAAQIRRL
jgi:peptidoglycan/LPS O-acetylase OafA/YrhL